MDDLDILALKHDSADTKYFIFDEYDSICLNFERGFSTIVKLSD